ncbi:MAG: TIGR04282 family arsenosugar biosynthesis glycosyltransferase [Bacteroidetes bacterium]|nr:TIGR04282 family arsenosugar biosynthesis glycosyltransferase [Bacteroidota bacterium]
MGEQRLIIFYRNPVLGKVKTRLAAAIGEDEALDLYLRLCVHTLSVVKEAQPTKVVYYSDRVVDKDLWDEAAALKKRQLGESLGDRMLNAFTQEFQGGADAVVIIGTDCPELRTAHLLEAFARLSENDLVVGPASDGGYYLLGMRKLQPELFHNKSWGHSSVFKSTWTDAEKLGLSVHLLPVLNDVDRKEDLIHMKNILGKTD